MRIIRTVKILIRTTVSSIIDGTCVLVGLPIFVVFSRSMSTASDPSRSVDYDMSALWHSADDLECSLAFLVCVHTVCTYLPTCAHPILYSSLQLLSFHAITLLPSSSHSTPHLNSVPSVTLLPCRVASQPKKQGNTHSQNLDVVHGPAQHTLISGI